MIAPVAPTGWPSAIAPPFGLTFAGSRPRPLFTAKSLCREGVVAFDDIEIADRHAGPFQQVFHRRNRADPHDFWAHARMGIADDPGFRLESSLLWPPMPWHSTIAAAPSLMPDAFPAVTVPSFWNTVFSPPKRLYRGRLCMFIGIERHHVALSLHLDWHNLTGKAALFDSFRGALSGFRGQRYPAASRVIVMLGRDIFRGHAHVSGAERASQRAQHHVERANIAHLGAPTLIRD